MIPKIIHYCWFGRGEKPADVLNYINDWKEKLPDYEYIEWNEDNFDVYEIPYVREAYEARKFAFVSDYVRIHALYEFGGVYLDTDIEIKKDPTPLFADRKMVIGYETDETVLAAFFACEKGIEPMKELLDWYKVKKFKLDNGKYDTTPNPVIVTEIMKNYGLKPDGKHCFFGDNFEIYPFDVFSAFNIPYQKLEITENTYLVHHCNGSWQTKREKFKPFVKSIALRIIGQKNFDFLKAKFYKKEEVYSTSQKDFSKLPWEGEKELISVIVPVYKVKDYLERCVLSIKNQTYENLEIILVDDGSPDRCGAMCDDFAKEDERIKVIHRKNGGLSAARNSGLSVAKGAYVGFVDSDDYLEPEMFETLYACIKRAEADIAVCGYKTFGQRNEEYKFEERVLTGEEATFLLVEDKVMPSYAWNKLYKNTEDLRFKLGALYEDILLMHKLFMKAERVVVSGETLYNYYIREDSITGVTKLNADALFEALRHRSHDLKNTPYYEKNLISLYIHMRRIVYELYLEGEFDSEYAASVIRRARGVNKKCFKAMNFKQMACAIVFGVAPKLYCKIRKLVK